MLTTSLRRVGGSVMLAVPPAILELLNLRAGATVSVTVDGGRLVVDPTTRPVYTMGELLAASDYSQERSVEDADWVDAAPVGRELL